MTDTGKMYKLSESDLTVADPAEDVQGRDVLDSSGDEIGTVDDLLLDSQESKVRFLQVAQGGFLGIGEDHYLIPVDAVTRVDEDHVHIDRQRGQMTDVPGYSPTIAAEPNYYGDVYGYWGYGPYWSPGYIYPAYP